MTLRSIAMLVAVGALLAACSSDKGAPDSGEPDDSPVANLDLEPRTPTAEELIQLRARSLAALRSILPGASDANLANVRPGFAGAICGEVETSGTSATQGGPRLFIVTANGQATVSATPELNLADPDDPFPDLYMQFCATTEELSRIGVRLEGARPPDLTLNSPAPEALVIPGDAVEERPRPVEDSRQPRRSGDDSFFNSVLRSTPQDGPAR